MKFSVECILSGLTKSRVPAGMVVSLSWLRVLWYGTKECVFMYIIYNIVAGLCDRYSVTPQVG